MGLSSATAHLKVEEVRAALIANGNNKRAVSNLFGIKERTMGDYIARHEIDVTSEIRAKALEAMGLTEREAISAVIPNQEIKGISRLYKTDDGGLAWVKTDQKKQDIRETLEVWKQEMLSDIIPVAEIEAPKQNIDDLAIVIPIGDHHVGMYAWAAESGDDWNLEIAEKYLCTAFKYLVDKAPPASKCIIANVGDFLHYNGMQAITDRSKHVLDASGRPQEMRRVAYRTLRYCIEYAASKFYHVESINAGGNHDDTTLGIFNMALACQYEDNKRIKIHDEPTSRHYSRHGNCLFGVVHGHQTKDRDLPAIMATERSGDWGQTKHRVWFRGHHHHDSRVEYTGAIVEQVRTLAANDDYASGGGYLSGRDIKMITYHKEYGEVGREICGIDLLKTMIS